MSDKTHLSTIEIRARKARARDMLDKLNGTGKYHGDMGNICYGDGIFARSIMEEFQCDDLTKLREWASK